jgi:hypothetical protein
MPFEAGAVSNPTGKNGKQFKAAVRLAVNRTDGDKTKLAQIAEKLVEMAVAGDMQAIKEVADRTDGKATQPVGGDSDAPLTLSHEIVIRAAYPKHDAGD